MSPGCRNLSVAQGEQVDNALDTTEEAASYGVQVSNTGLRGLLRREAANAKGAPSEGKNKVRA